MKRHLVLLGLLAMNFLAFAQSKKITDHKPFTQNAITSWANNEEQLIAVDPVLKGVLRELQYVYITSYSNQLGSKNSTQFSGFFGDLKKVFLVGTFSPSKDQLSIIIQGYNKKAKSVDFMLIEYNLNTKEYKSKLIQSLKTKGSFKAKNMGAQIRSSEDGNYFGLFYPEPTEAKGAPIVMGGMTATVVVPRTFFSTYDKKGNVIIDNQYLLQRTLGVNDEQTSLIVSNQGEVYGVVSAEVQKEFEVSTFTTKDSFIEKTSKNDKVTKIKFIRVKSDSYDSLKFEVLNLRKAMYIKGTQNKFVVCSYDNLLESGLKTQVFKIDFNNKKINKETAIYASAQQNFKLQEMYENGEFDLYELSDIQLLSSNNKLYVTFKESVSKISSEVVTGQNHKGSYYVNERNLYVNYSGAIHVLEIDQENYSSKQYSIPSFSFDKSYFSGIANSALVEIDGKVMLISAEGGDNDTYKKVYPNSKPFDFDSELNLIHVAKDSPLERETLYKTNLPSDITERMKYQIRPGSVNMDIVGKYCLVVGGLFHVGQTKIIPLGDE